MASNPPFNMEDQTDEDFFDKLVEDDLEPLKPGQDEGNDSDGPKAVANLGVTDGDASIEKSDGGESVNEVNGEKSSVQLDTGLFGTHEGEGNSMFSMPVGNDSRMEPSNDRKGSEATPASAGSKSNEIASSGVKEVGWNSFYADSKGGIGFGSYSDFFNGLGDQSGGFPRETYNNLISEMSSRHENHDASSSNSNNYGEYQDSQGYASIETSTSEHDLNSSQYWENLYPGWKFDTNTGQWYQIDGYNETVTTQENYEANSSVDWTAANRKAEVSYLQQTTQSVTRTLAETGTTESVSSWNQVSHGNNGYPEHMVFDPQYPGWYYDTIAQEWRTLEGYSSSIQGLENGTAASSTFLNNGDSFYNEYGQASNYGSQDVSSQALDGSWNSTYGSNHQQGLDMYTAETVNGSVDNSSGGNQQFGHSYGSSISASKNQQMTSSSFGSVPLYNKVGHGHSLANETVELQSFIPGTFNYSNTNLDEPKNFSNNDPTIRKPINHSQQSFPAGQQLSYAPHVGRSSAGRPPHALVTFGFGGKLIIMKDSSLLNSSYGSQGSVSVLNLTEVVMGSINSFGIENGARDYFHALCQQSFPGPLVGGSVGSKELYKWIDERIAHCESPDMDYIKGERLRLLLSLLKIACQHYGKLRSPFGTDTLLIENDTPESAVANLFAYTKKKGTEFTQYGLPHHCLQNLPSEGQMRATATEVQNLLVSGKKIEALQCAQEGQLWGPALVLASQLGDQFYVDTVKQMALRQLVAGSPLRTLCLLIAGQPAEVFSIGTSISGFSNSVNMPQQPAQFESNGMLSDWEENLAVITANRTKGDELVIIHLGDCLWKERSEITAAHICYLVAEANFESYSDTARLCLIGADHLKYPRTYASPEAIQRTELYEYSKMLGNSQFILLPFLPYKLIYAYMLAEVGKVSDSLKYCQAVLKSLKTGRAPEVETWKQFVLSLEERIRTHQQGGYATNLAPAKLVGKLLNFFDSTAHRVVGGLPPPAPLPSQGIGHGNEQSYQPMAPRVPNSQSTMAMSSLVPSSSTEPICERTADSNKRTMHNRSVSEPAIGRSPRQETTSPDSQGKASDSGGTSRFSRFSFGTSLLQKTVGLVLRPRLGRQAKLGEKNKFYYDEKLKRWVEEGVEPPAEEAALPPPPITASFQNGNPDYNLKSALKTEGSPSNDGPELRTMSTSENTSGIPPIPPSSNQFSARGRMGVRSRYVDTFNQGGGSSTNFFQSPSAPSVKPSLAANAKFFIPAPAPLPAEQTVEAIAECNHECNAVKENPSTFSTNDSFRSPKNSSSPSMQRFPSMDNISCKAPITNCNGSRPPHSRRTASWTGGSFNDAFSHPKTGDIVPLGEALGMPASAFMPDESSQAPAPMNGGNFGGLHEVEL
ncbi:protein transport protein SEC16B homolog isoform X2 [Prosopis cineraria]|uniref:protein transport protein SEC16B homolog isoform X2 n=1 Tax=Prosopis cineraria TaxID=364024 RepID=UPI00241045DD|nr:protein transport protein SEC16B homolog isoform X2 [Prosopis cineraria]